MKTIWLVLLMAVLNPGREIMARERRNSESLVDTLEQKRDARVGHFGHRLEGEYRGGYIFQTNRFLAGYNEREKVIDRFNAMHLKYAFQARKGTLEERVFGGVYQGVGVAWYRFGNRREVGEPGVVYLFQGARIARFSPCVSLNYEWNFGLSWGWHPYDKEHNSYNVMMGSRVNAFINTNFYLDWEASSRVRLRLGLDLSHFSNGNTRLPNAGLNTIGAKLGLVYCLDGDKTERFKTLMEGMPVFQRHMSYDVVLFGSWRRKVYEESGEFVLSPSAYAVLGAGVSAMYNLSYKVRLGGAFDVVYDASANEFYAHDPSMGSGFVKPPLSAKVALGVSARAEYVMPFFTVGVGLGRNVLHRGGELKAFYQMLYLKLAVTRSTFLHVGYRLQEFSTPNYLMLGVGFRLNNKYPRFQR